MNPKLLKDLKKRREELGLSNYRISKITGIDQSVLSKYDSGKLIPTLENLYKLGEVLELELIWKKK